MVRAIGETVVQVAVQLPVLMIISFVHEEMEDDNGCNI